MLNIKIKVDLKIFQVKTNGMLKHQSNRPLKTCKKYYLNFSHKNPLPQNYSFPSPKSSKHFPFNAIPSGGRQKLFLL